MTIYISSNREYLKFAAALEEALKNDLSCKIKSTWHDYKKVTTPEKLVSNIANSDLILAIGVTPGDDKWLEIGIAYGYYKKIILFTKEQSNLELTKLTKWIIMEHVTKYKDLISYIKENFADELGR